MKLSLSMIVKNEEKFLPGCLESVKGLVDEIVVVDTGSDDATKRIAAEFGARVSDFEWCDDFSAARNEALRKSTGDWILYLDADERIDPRFHRKIRKLISNRRADAYLLSLKSKIGTNEDSHYHLVSYPRLFRMMNGLAFVGRVHEQITTSLNAAGARIAQSDVIIDHLGYARDEEVIRAKAGRNYRLLLAQIERRENLGYALYQLGQTEIVLGEREKGVAHLREALSTGGFGKSVEASIYGVIAENTFKSGDAEGALDACDRSIEAVGEQTFSHYLKGEIHFSRGEFDLAEESFRSALERYNATVAKGKAATAIEPVFDIDIIYMKLGKAAMLAGDNSTARSSLARAVELKPLPPRVAAYLEFLAKNREYTEAIRVADKFRQFESEDWYRRILSSIRIDTGDFAGASDLLRRITEPDVVSLSSLANCRMKLGDFAGAAGAFHDAVAHGYDDPQGLQMYGLVQFGLGDYAGAIGTLDAVLRTDPANQQAEKFIRAARAQLGKITGEQVSIR